MFKRVLLKISGNFFADPNGQGLNFDAIKLIVAEISALRQIGVAVGIVNGAGNIFRGRARPADFDRVAADKIGMVATLPNAIALTEMLNANGIDTHLMCSVTIPGLACHFDAFKARRLLSEGKIVIIAGGTGHPYFTTDTTAVLRALEIKAEVLLKATDVDGVYSADPQTDASAVKYARLTYAEALDKQLAVMDQTAFALARENQLPILVFKFEPGALVKVISEPTLGTVISS